MGSVVWPILNLNARFLAVVPTMERSARSARYWVESGALESPGRMAFPVSLERAAWKEAVISLLVPKSRRRLSRYCQSFRVCAPPPTGASQARPPCFVSCRLFAAAIWSHLLELITCTKQRWGVAPVDLQRLVVIIGGWLRMAGFEYLRLASLLIVLYRKRNCYAVL